MSAYIDQPALPSGGPLLGPLAIASRWAAAVLTAKAEPAHGNGGLTALAFAVAGRVGIGNVDQADGVAVAFLAAKLRPNIPFHGRRVWAEAVAELHQGRALAYGDRLSCGSAPSPPSWNRSEFETSIPCPSIRYSAAPVSQPQLHRGGQWHPGSPRRR